MLAEIYQRHAKGQKHIQFLSAENCRKKNCRHVVAWAKKDPTALPDPAASASDGEQRVWPVACFEKFVQTGTGGDFQARATFVRITGAGLQESHVHDVNITREAPNYPTR